MLIRLFNKMTGVPILFEKTELQTKSAAAYEPNVYSPAMTMNLSGGVVGGWSTYSGDTYKFNIPLAEPGDILYEGNSATEGSDEDNLGDHEYFFKASENKLFFRDDSGNPDDLDKTDLLYRIWPTGIEAGSERFSAGNRESVLLDSSDVQGLVIMGRALRSADKTITIRFRARAADADKTGEITLGLYNHAIGDGVPGDVAALSDQTFDLTAGYDKHELVFNVSDLEAGEGDLWEILFYRKTSEDSIDTSVSIPLPSIEVQHG